MTKARALAALCCALFFLVLTVAADAKTVVILRGLFGEVVAPMHDVADALTKRGHKVILGSWRAPPTVKADYVIGHSRGADVALRYPAATVISIDPTFLNPGCAAGKTCTNFHAPIDAAPFLICCGGYAAKGARNVKVPGTMSFFLFAPGHVSMPSRVKDEILKLVK